MPLGCPRVVIEDIADIPRLPPGIANGVPGIGDFELSEWLEIGVDQRGEAPKQSRPIARRHTTPRLEGVRSCLDGDIGLGERDRWDLGDDLLGGRVDDRKGVHDRILADAEPQTISPRAPSRSAAIHE